MFKRPHYIALGLVGLLALVLLNLPSHTAARLKVAISSLFLPLFGLANSSQQAMNHTTDVITPRSELLKQNEALRRENQDLHAQQLQAAQIKLENDRLRQLLGWQQHAPWKLKLANVVLRDPANWWRTVQIDLGSRDGIHANLAVLTADGLVGRVSNVGLTSSTVVLVGDRTCKVAAIVSESRDTGVIGVADPLDNSLVALGFLSKSATLKPGQSVLTSGLGGIFPAGITIGKVVDARPVEYGLYTEARVKLAANLSSLEEVWVVLP